MTRFLLGTVGLFGLVLSFFNFVYAQPLTVSPQGAVAEVLGRKIWAWDLKPEGDFFQDEPREMNEQESREWLWLYQREKIKEMILSPLLDQYAQDHQIEVLDSQTQPLMSLLTNDDNLQEERMAEEEFLEEIKARKMQLEETLELPHISEETRNKTFEELIRLGKAIPQLEKENLQEELVRMATEMVKIWKINRALYKRYGGRVVLEQAGPEPLDAYRDFLKEKEKEGAFRIYDQGLAQAFWEYFTDDRGHTFYTSEGGARWMETPWWLLEKEGQKSGGF